VTGHAVVALPLTRRGDLVVWELYDPDRTGDADLRTQVQAGVRAGVCSEVNEAEEIDDDGLPYLVHRGEEIDIVEAFARADRNAVLLWHALHAIGLGSEVLDITASLSADNQPVTRLRMTPTGGARLLKWLIASGPAPPHRRAG
jgi:hypothetical protein